MIIVKNANVNVSASCMGCVRLQMGDSDDYVDADLTPQQARRIAADLLAAAEAAENNADGHIPNPPTT